MEGLVVGGKYHVVQAIGQGGMGAVYDAVHATTGRRVALKLIHERTIASGGPAARRRFEREARAAASIDSLHVVQVLDSGEDESSRMPFIVMEFLDGDDLRKLLRGGRLSPSLATAIAIQIALGLKKAHQNDVVHRDLKPANVFLAKADGDRRVVKLLDFGIAKLASEGGSDTADLTSTGDLVGSPPYMSPEQLRSPRDVDRRTDIWSLGVVLYEMLAGRLPTEGIAPIGARVYAICHTPSPPITTFAPEVPPALAAIVHRALALEASERFQTVDELCEALRRLPFARADIPEHALAFAPSGTSMAVSNTVVTTLQAQVTNAPTARRRGWLVAAGACALVVLGWIGLHSGMQQSPPASDPIPEPRRGDPAPPPLPALVEPSSAPMPSAAAPPPGSAPPIASSATPPKPTAPRPGAGHRVAPRSPKHPPPAPAHGSSDNGRDQL